MVCHRFRPSFPRQRESRNGESAVALDPRLCGGGARRDPIGKFAGPARGFTLIEMIVVLAILTFALVLIVGYRAPWSGGLALDATAAELASELRLARSEAIADNRPVTLELDLAGHRYRVGNGKRRPLPANFAIELLTISGERLGAEAGGIRFNPDGSSTGGHISLGDGRRRVAIGADWLTGRVSIADVR